MLVMVITVKVTKKSTWHPNAWYVELLSLLQLLFFLRYPFLSVLARGFTGFRISTWV